MKKINLIELMQNNSETLPSGARIVDMPEVVEIKKENADLAMVLRGYVTIVSSTAGKKNVELISTGQACFFDEDDECIIPQEGSVFLLINKRIRQKESNSGGFLSRFGKKKKEGGEITSDINATDIHEMEEEKEKSVLLSLMPKVKQTWYQVAGPISAGIINDEANFKGVATTVYTVLPMPIRLVVKEEFFVNWCYEKRHIFLVENMTADNEAKAYDQDIALDIAPINHERVNP